LRGCEGGGEGGCVEGPESVQDAATRPSNVMGEHEFVRRSTSAAGSVANGVVHLLRGDDSGAVANPLLSCSTASSIAASTATPIHNLQVYRMVRAHV
jgi:hypothetical protein